MTDPRVPPEYPPQYYQQYPQPVPPSGPAPKKHLGVVLVALVSVVSLVVIVLAVIASQSKSDSYKRGDERLRDFVGTPVILTHLTSSERDVNSICPRLLNNLRDRGEQLVGQDFIDGCKDAAHDLGL